MSVLAYVQGLSFNASLFLIQEASFPGFGATEIQAHSFPSLDAALAHTLTIMVVSSLHIGWEFKTPKSGDIPSPL